MTPFVSHVWAFDFVSRSTHISARFFYFRQELFLFLFLILFLLFLGYKNKNNSYYSYYFYFYSMLLLFLKKTFVFTEDDVQLL